MKLLLENWRKYLNEGEEDFFPWLRELNSLDNPTSADIIKKFPNWSVLGRGAYRVTFQPPGEKDYVVKVVREKSKNYTSAGEVQRQNEAEFKIGANFPQIFPKSYSHHPEYDWIVVENIEVFPSVRSRDVLKSLKKSFPKLVSFIDDVYYGGLSSFQNTGDILEYILAAATKGTEYEVGVFTPKLEKVFEFGMKYSKVFRELHRVINEFSNDISDISHGNIGKGSDGRFVILDASVFD